MNELSIFNYEQQEIRTVIIDGEPWFVAKDVCEVLGLGRQQDSTRHLDEDEKGECLVGTPSGVQSMVVISESGLYSLTIKSRKPEAKLFKRWITHEVLPTIRKTGGAYMSLQKAEDLLADPDLVIGLAQQIKDLRLQAERQQQQIEADRPKTLFADALSTSESSILVRELAKLLKQNGIDIGQNRLFDWLREHGYLIKAQGSDRGLPTQRSMDLCLFEVKTRPIIDASGTVRISKTVKVTGKGQLYFINKFLNEKTEAAV